MDESNIKLITLFYAHFCHTNPFAIIDEAEKDEVEEECNINQTKVVTSLNNNK